MYCGLRGMNLRFYSIDKEKKTLERKEGEMKTLNLKK